MAEEPKSPSKIGSRAKKLNRNEALLAAARRARELLPGDSRFGDALSTAGDEQAHMVGRRISALSAREGTSVLKEAGMGALQVWQSVSEASGRGRGDTEATVAFTDLVEFSAWALEAGDDASLDLLRDVGEAIEPPVAAHGGKVVKRLGDGMMACFPGPGEAVEAILEGRERLSRVSAPGYDPVIRAGLHHGRPRSLGGDLLGVDVNIAARVAEEASGDELLISDRALEHLDSENYEAKRKKRRFKVKGVPNDVVIYAVERKA